MRRQVFARHSGQSLRKERDAVHLSRIGTTALPGTAGHRQIAAQLSDFVLQRLALIQQRFDASDHIFGLRLELLAQSRPRGDLVLTGI